MDPDLSPRPIDLAQEPAFSLDGLEVKPATLEVLAEGRREQLEPRIMQVLVALARRRGEVVSRDELIQTCWGGRIVGDDSINRCIFRLRKLAEKLGGFDIATVPRVGFRLTEVARDRPPPQPAWRRPRALAGLSLAAVLILAAAGVWMWRTVEASDAPATPRIAVGAFDAIGADPETQAISARLADALAGALNENVTAVGPPGSGADAADLVIAGAVSRVGGLVRVRAHLTDRRSGFTLWSAQFERPSADEAGLRDAVAVAASETIVSALEAFRQPGLKLDPRSMALLIRVSNATTTPQTLAPDEGITAAEQLVVRAPRFGYGHALLALYLVPRANSAPGRARDAVLARAQVEGHTAIRLSPKTSGAAHDALYYAARVDDPANRAGAEDILLAGLRADPDHPFLSMRECHFLTGVGRLAEGLKYCERAMALRPLAAPIGHTYAKALSYNGRHDLAEQVLTKAARFHPGHERTRWRRIELPMLYGSPERALTILHDPDQRPLFLREQDIQAFEAFLKARQTKAAGDQARSLSVSGRDAPQWAALGAAAFGRLDDAFAALADPRLDPDTIGQLLFEPVMAPVRRDPRFWSIAARAGLVTYWRKRGVWPDFCADPAHPIDCPREAARVSGVPG